MNSFFSNLCGVLGFGGYLDCPGEVQVIRPDLKNSLEHGFIVDGDESGMQSLILWNHCRGKIAGGGFLSYANGQFVNGLTRFALASRS